MCVCVCARSAMVNVGFTEIPCQGNRDKRIMLAVNGYRKHHA